MRQSFRANAGALVQVQTLKSSPASALKLLVANMFAAAQQHMTSLLDTMMTREKEMERNLHIHIPGSSSAAAE